MSALQRALSWHLPIPLWWVVGPIVAWRVGLRIYRLTARQDYSGPSFRRRAASLGAVTLGVAAVTFEERHAFYALCAGLVAGIAVAVVALRWSSLRLRTNSTTVQPDPLTGLALSALLVGRIVWRLVVGASDESAGWTVAEFVRNPSTMACFGLYSAHYFVYSLGIVGAVHRHAPDRP